MLPLLLLLAAAPPELGTIHWERDFEMAVRRSRETHKPLLVLFDEVPGCSTVLGFGKNVLSDQRIVAQVEARFVPVAVFNNIAGPDAKVLAQFGEPAWNNPVVRIIDADLKPLAQRFDGPYDVETFATLISPWTTKKLETLTVTAGCFWECEARLDSLPAVRASRVGYLDGQEVVEVQFDPNISSRTQMLEAAKQHSCQPRADGSFETSEKDTKYFLKSKRTVSGMSEAEKVRLNAKASGGSDGTGTH